MHILKDNAMAWNWMYIIKIPTNNLYLLFCIFSSEKQIDVWK